MRFDDGTDAIVGGSRVERELAGDRRPAHRGVHRAGVVAARRAARRAVGGDDARARPGRDAHRAGRRALPRAARLDRAAAPRARDRHVQRPLGARDGGRAAGRRPTSTRASSTRRARPSRRAGSTARHTARRSRCTSGRPPRRSRRSRASSTSSSSTPTRAATSTYYEAVLPRLSTARGDRRRQHAGSTAACVEGDAADRALQRARRRRPADASGAAERPRRPDADPPRRSVLSAPTSGRGLTGQRRRRTRTGDERPPCRTDMSWGQSPDMSERDSRLRAVRLIVARCEVTYTGRLNAFLPESTRLLMIKDDGSVLVHADAGGYQAAELDDAADGDRGRRATCSSSASAPAAARTGSRSGCSRCSPTSSTRWARRPGSRRTASSATCSSRSPTTRGDRAGPAARPARVADRHRPGRPDVPRRGRRLGRGRDQARRHDRRGRAAHPLPRVHPPRPRARPTAAASSPRSRSSRRRSRSPSSAGSAAPRSTSPSCAASASPS